MAEKAEGGLVLQSVLRIMEEERGFLGEDLMMCRRRSTANSGAPWIVRK